MADYFCQFCEAFYADEDEVKWLEDFVEGINEDNLNADGEPTGRYARLAINPEMFTYGPEFDLMTEEPWDNKHKGKKLVVISSDLSGNPDHVGEIIQQFLREFRPTDFFTLTWANTCSKTRVGAFSGGYMVVTAERCIGRGGWHNVGSFANRLSRRGYTRMEQVSE